MCSWSSHCLGGILQLCTNAAHTTIGSSQCNLACQHWPLSSGSVNDRLQLCFELYDEDHSDTMDVGEVTLPHCALLAPPPAYTSSTSHPCAASLHTSCTAWTNAAHKAYIA